MSDGGFVEAPEGKTSLFDLTSATAVQTNKHDLVVFRWSHWSTSRPQSETSSIGTTSILHIVYL